MRWLWRDAAATRRRCRCTCCRIYYVCLLLSATPAHSTYSPDLQLRALELSVGVALDRVPAAKSAANEPPVSNSLMAAIKRSQANQRRHPKTFHLYQQMQLSSSSQSSPLISAVEVELKHFVMSILDDPGDAGFRTQEIKLAVLNPLGVSRIATTAPRPQPLFPSSLDNFELSKRVYKFPFSEATANDKIYREFEDRRSSAEELDLHTLPISHNYFLHGR